MKKLGWFAVSAAVMAVIATGVLLLAANLYVQSQGAQQRIKQTLAEVFRVPVSLKKTTVTPWEGLRLDGVALLASAPPATVVDTSDKSHFLMAESLRVRVEWWPLLAQRHVQIKEILLDHPRLAWAQDDNGRWVWPDESPSSHHKKSVPSQPPESIATGAGPTQTTSPVMAATSPLPFPVSPSATVAAGDVLPASPSHLPETILVEKFRVRHGTLDFLNATRSSLGQFEELDADGLLNELGHVNGEVRFRQAVFARAGFRLTDFHSRFKFDDQDGLTIDDGKGSFAGGELQASFTLHPHEPGSPFRADCQIDNVDLSQLIKEAGSPLILLEGRLQGELQFQGDSDVPDRRRATGDLRLVGAQLRNVPFLQAVGEMLRIEDLSHLQFKQAELHCQLVGNDLEIAPLHLASNDLQMTAQGHYSTDTDQLSIHGKLIIDQAVGHQLPQFIEMNFLPCGNDAPGSRYIEFDVTGPLSKPSTNLFDRVLAGPSNGLLQNLLAPKPRKAHPKGSKTDPQTPQVTPTRNGGT